MKNFYITFGQSHVHTVETCTGEKTFDKDTVAKIKAETHGEAREIAFDKFGAMFCTSYTEEKITEEFMSYFPRGIIALN